MSGGGEPTYSIDQLNQAITTITPPSREDNPWLYEDDAFGDRRLNAWYNNEIQKKAREMQGPTPQEQQAQAIRLIMRENAPGRIPDPDYDITARNPGDYAQIDLPALALQRARDYADDLEESLKAQGKKYSTAERERIVANRQATELNKLNANGLPDGQRAKIRDDRRLRLILGQTKFKPGTSLLDEDPEKEKNPYGSLL